MLYQKVLYDHLPGFALHHTYGDNAYQSTQSAPHICSNYLLYFCIQGGCSINVEDVCYDIRPGDLVLLSPKEIFCFRIDPNQYHERIVLHIYDNFLQSLSPDSATLFEPLRNRRKACNNLIPSEIVQSSGIRALLQEMLTLVKNDCPSNRILTTCKTAEILIKLNNISWHDKQCPIAQEDSLIRCVLYYLNKHFSSDLTVNTIAEAFHISPSFLSHSFKLYTGMSVWNYVIARRIHNFNELVRSGCSIEQACWNSGFQNYSNFFRLYKKHMGITPTQFKKQHKNNRA